MQNDQATADKWSGAAPFWEKHREIIRLMFAPVAGALVEDARIAAGQTVLDIASGSGEPALAIAALVGPAGKVCGIDPVPAMVTASRRASDQFGLTNTRFDVAFADRLPFPDDTFDAAVSRFGAMFFAAPQDAVREMLRVLKPGAGMALAVWHLAETNPFFHAIARVIQRFVESAPDPGAPDAFRFAAPGRLRDILGEAGVMAP